MKNIHLLLIRDDTDFEQHCDYIHYNPVKHGLCNRAAEWQYSSFHRYVTQGIYPIDWRIKGKLISSIEAWDM